MPSQHGLKPSAKTASQALGSRLQMVRQQPLAAAGLCLLLLFVAAAIFAPLLAPDDPDQLQLHARMLAPGAHHWLGTDELGRDILSRILFGARISLIVAVSVVGISLSIGLVTGALAGMYGGWLDILINVYLTNAFLALPGILLAIAFVAFLGPGLLNLILALSISGWVGYARLVRAQVMAVRQREFVEAAPRALGASDLRLFTRHILPNILQPLIVQAAIGMAGAVLAEATLSFLGLGIPAPAASWGSMLNDARSHLFDSPHMVVFPALAVMLAVLAFNFIGRRAARPARPTHPAGRQPLSLRVGVISDTHGLLRPEVLPALAGVNHILHAGDVGDPTILDALRTIAPVTAIRGNIDRHGPCAELPATEAVELGGRLFYLVHALEDLDIDPVAAGVAMVISGHSHKPRLDERDGVQYLNPGSAGPRRFRLPVTLALLTLEPDSIKAEIIPLVLH